MKGAATIRLNGEDLFPDQSGALFWPRRRTMIVADLHLEKGSGFASRGQFLPPYDTRATLTALKAVLGRWQPARVIALGDSMDDAAAVERIAPADREAVRSLVSEVEWLWIAGNHDPAPPAEWGGQAVDVFVEGPFLFRHEAARERVAGEISGHFHPKVSVSTRGRRISARCFVEDGSRLILPSFGAYTGGLDIFDAAFAPLFKERATLWLLGRERVHRFDRTALAR